MRPHDTFVASYYYLNLVQVNPAGHASFYERHVTAYTK